VGDVPYGPLKYVVFNYQSEKTTIVENGDYSADSQYFYYDFILHAPPTDTIAEVSASRTNHNDVYLRVWQGGMKIYDQKCDFGNLTITY
jgi:hypothetical protein